ncbi:hypothetical protein J5I95_22765 [Candidatus Poribacteria bacterium]|nr:hypothetical protein [Candidatus Poribacteria bacterium]
MKTLLIAFCLLCVFLLGLTLYTHYDTKKFVENLPQAPTKQRVVDAEEKTPTQHEAITPGNQGKQTLEETPPVSDTHGHLHEHPDSHGHTHPHESLVELSPVSESDATQHMEEPVAAPSGEQLPPGVVAWKSVSPDGIIEIDREAFLAEFGNHPNAYTYLTLHRKVNTADTYTYREIYEFMVLEKEFTQSLEIQPSHLEKMRKRAAQTPDRKITSWRSFSRTYPNARIREIN